VCPYGSTTTVKGAAVSKQGRLLGAPTDWRILCSPISSIPAVRQLTAGKSGLAKRSSPGSTRGRKVENFDSNGCAHGARKARRRRRCISVVRRNVPRRRRARETPRRRRKHRGGDVRARQCAGSGRAQSACLVWRRERSGHAGVCAGHTGR
jgi:hypothetical protein